MESTGQNELKKSSFVGKGLPVDAPLPIFVNSFPLYKDKIKKIVRTVMAEAHNQ